MGLTLSEIPGFADVKDSSFAAEKYALGIQLARINSNANSGMVRLEVFDGMYKDGDQVTLPTSRVDGYVYSREELTYIWGIASTFNPSTGHITGPDSLWYCSWLVRQSDGQVFCNEAYRKSNQGGGASQNSTDGTLHVVTIAQRQAGSMTMAAVATFDPLSPSAAVTNKAYDTNTATAMNKTAKFANVKVECIYMGEFYTGQTVPQPVSPVDGYVYGYAQVKFAHSWRWTTLGNASTVTQPDLALDQLAPIAASVSALGVVACSVKYYTPGAVVGWIIGPEALVTKTDHGRIAVFAICQRTSGSQNQDYQMHGAQGPYLTVANAGLAAGADPLHSSSDPVYGLIVPVVPGQTIVVTGDTLGHDTAGYTGIICCWGTGSDGKTTTRTLPIVTGNLPSQTVPAFDPVTLLPITSIQVGIKFRDYIGHGQPFTDVELRALNGGGHWSANVTLTGGVTTSPSSGFSELTSDDFFPGETLRASTVKQLENNILEAIGVPEVFGSAIYHDGDTVPLPTSTIDGYHYVRGELTYVWEWADTLNQTGTHLREPAFLANVDGTTGVVTLETWRLPPGGPGIGGDNTKPTLKVTVLAHRNRSGAATSTPSSNIPSDWFTTAQQDQSGGQQFQVNGV